MKFMQRFEELIGILKRGSISIIPVVQIDELEHNPIFNPTLSIEPQDWWIESFDWYVAVEIISGGRYGPFYRIDGEHFWPQIGKPSNRFSEKKCFFGLEKPINDKDAKKKYKLQKDTQMEYTYEFTIECSNLSPSESAFIFIGPVKDGTGYQMNPNTITANIIKSMIINGNVHKEKLPKNKKDS